MNKRLLAGFAVGTLMLATTACGNTDSATTKIDWSKVEYTALSTEVTPEELDSAIDELINSGYKEVATDRTIATENDIVTVDYTVTADGTEYANCVGEKYSLVEKELYLEEFVSAILGMEIGEEKSIEITHPEDSGHELSGKTATYLIKLTDVKEAGRYGKDDELALACGLTTYSELVDTLRANLEAEKVQAAYQADRISALSAYADVMNIIVDEATVQTRYEDMLTMYKDFATSYGFTYEEYVEMMYGTSDIDSFENYLLDSAVYDVTIDKVTGDIIEKEKITLTDDKYNTELEALAIEYGTDVETLKQSLSEDEIKETIIENMAIDKLMESATKK